MKSTLLFRLWSRTQELPSGWYFRLRQPAFNPYWGLGGAGKPSLRRWARFGNAIWRRTKSVAITLMQTKEICKQDLPISWKWLYSCQLQRDATPVSFGFGLTE